VPLLVRWWWPRSGGTASGPDRQLSTAVGWMGGVVVQVGWPLVLSGLCDRVWRDRVVGWSGWSLRTA
jgi:hypothetical protein